ncbi:short coiled-coil protein isoform X1 [Peromyscus californicus insignis]|uniref:short coiled-coil protein isoform X1 n=1 Tax=Peromyscus californicus insignis TaxID=564181 RepID=UPI0022A6B318|nr:short coiled-coil protein isoform X1 [Peromyscus californicus insignis]
MIGRCLPRTRPTVLIGPQCPFVRAKVDPVLRRGLPGRPAASAQACNLELGLVGGRLLARRTLRGREGRGCRCQLVGEPRPEASSASRPLPAPPTQDHSSKSVHSRAESLLPKMMNADMDAVDTENQVELEEKTRLINQVLELQHTLEDLSARVDAVKEENLKLKSENQVLGQYIENLMSASSVFQTTDTKSKRK